MMLVYELKDGARHLGLVPWRGRTREEARKQALYETLELGVGCEMFETPFARAAAITRATVTLTVLGAVIEAV